MVLETLAFLAALAGTAIGGWSDLKTTEISDSVPLSMAAAGIILHIATAISTGSWHMLTMAIAVAIGYLIAGYLLYYTGQWGEADVLMLAATGFIIPLPLSFFNIEAAEMIYPLIFLLNTFIVGGIYSLAYAFILTLKKPEVYNDFGKRIKKSIKSIILLFIAITGGFMAMTTIAARALGTQITATTIAEQAIVFSPFTLSIILLYHFAKSLDEIAFKKRIPKDKLMEGDVLAEDLTITNTTNTSNKNKKDSKDNKNNNRKDEVIKGKLFIGLTAEQIKAIKDEKSITEVEIKEGIRYAPTFFLAILFTWLFGNWMTYVFGVI